MLRLSPCVSGRYAAGVVLGAGDQGHTKTHVGRIARMRRIHNNHEIPELQLHQRRSKARAVGIQEYRAPMGKGFQCVTLFQPEDMTVASRRLPSDDSNGQPFTLMRRGLPFGFVLEDIRARLGANATVTGISEGDRYSLVHQVLFVHGATSAAVMALNEGDNPGYTLAPTTQRPDESVEYTIALHSVIDPLTARAAVARVNESGFINYYDKFGSYSFAGTHPGLALLKGEFRAAAAILLNGAEHLTDSALDGMDSIRRRVALGLRSTTAGAESESACRQAFEDLGVGPCRALVHEFQQVLWNEIATQRLRSGGRRAIQGDVVYNGSGLSLAGDNKTFQLHDVLIPVPGSDSLARPSRVTGIVESTLRRHGLTTSDSPSHSIFSGDNNALGCTFIGEFRSICVVPAIACGDAAERTVSLRFSLPPGVSPWMAIRELCKFDEIRAPKIFKLHVPEGMRQETPQSVRQKAIQLYSAQRWRQTHKAPALDSAKLLQSIFHSSGMRKSLIPSPRGHDDVH